MRGKGCRPDLLKAADGGGRVERLIHRAQQPQKFTAPWRSTWARLPASMPPMATAVSGELRMMRPIRSRPRVGSGRSLVGVGNTGPTPI